jgi:hypothetical protein
MAKKTRKQPTWVWALVFGLGIVVYLATKRAGPKMFTQTCPGSQVLCPGVGCVSGKDKCTPGAAGGPSAIFSKEGFFAEWPGPDVSSTPPVYGKETFVPAPPTKTCPDGTRSSGACLMEFPGL